MDDARDLESIIGHSVDEDIGCPGHKELARARNAPWASDTRVSRKRRGRPDQPLSKALSSSPVALRYEIRGGLHIASGVTGPDDSHDAE
jgi:hypothetical protein